MSEKKQHLEKLESRCRKLKITFIVLGTIYFLYFLGGLIGTIIIDDGFLLFALMVYAIPVPFILFIILGFWRFYYIRKKEAGLLEQK